MVRVRVVVIVLSILVIPLVVKGQFSATTTLTLSICGNGVVDSNEQCDIPGETGVYSQTIVGRQCTTRCQFGPYCGDGVLQSAYNEQCDDANNTDGDFCSAICEIEPAGSGGGGSSGGGSGGKGGSTKELGDTLVTVTGRGYPSRTVNFILDSKSVGSVQTNNAGEFEFSTKASPGTATLGIWSTDNFGTRSVTFNNTFDVTQGAITNLNDLVLPPSLKLSKTSINAGEIITASGQSVPNATIQLFLDKNATAVGNSVAAANGTWSISYNSSRLSNKEHLLRVRSQTGTPPLTVLSNFSTAVQLFVGVNGESSSPSDLNRDGKVNLTDFSILIFWWNTNGGDSDPKADINGNGRVSLEDFSILLFNWSG
jgi:cysteine-rich repeat protein